VASEARSRVLDLKWLRCKSHGIVKRNTGLLFLQQAGIFCPGQSRSICRTFIKQTVRSLCRMIACKWMSGKAVSSHP